MTTTLKLSDQMLEMGRRFVRLGCDHEALDVLGKLAGFGELPADICEAAHLHLAELHHKKKKFKQARRHLAILLAAHPDCAHYHYLMGAALSADDKVDTRKALRHYRKASELAPENPDYLSDYGLCLLAEGQIAEGLVKLGDAVTIAPDGFRHVRNLATSLLDADQTEAAKQVVLAALFRNAGDHRFRKLWNDVRWQESRRGQMGYDAAALTERGPVILKFPAAKARTRTTRRDTIEILPMGEPAPRKDAQIAK